MGRGVRRRPKLLAAKLREIRDALGLLQGELIERLGLTDYVNQVDISDFERGVREPDLLTLKAYADEAGVMVDELIDDNLDLPKKLPAVKPARGASEKSREGRAKALMNTTTVTLWLPIKSQDGSAREESRARKTIEKAHLKQYGMKKLTGDEYELTISHQNDADLYKQIYALLGAIKIEAERRNCSAKVDFREKGGDRRW
jgi:transcriptional regulator with XRE-family HTH domain